MDGAPLPGTLKESEISQDRLKRFLETGVSLHRDPVWGTWGGWGVLLLGNLRDYGRKAPEIEHLSLSIRELC